MNASEEKPPGEKAPEVFLPAKDGKKNKKRFFTINRRALPYKVHFFLFVGGMGAVLPYQSAFGINQLGLTATNLSAVFGAQQLIFLVLKPLIGFLTDYYNRLKATLIILTVVQAIFCFLLISIPKVDTDEILKSSQAKLPLKAEVINGCFDCVAEPQQITASLKASIFEDYLTHEVLCKLYSRQTDGTTYMGHALVISNQNNVQDDATIRGPQLLDFSLSTHETIDLNESARGTTHRASTPKKHSIPPRTACIRTTVQNSTNSENDAMTLPEYCYVTVFDASIYVRFNFPNTTATNFTCLSNHKTTLESSRFEADAESLLAPYIFKTYQFWLFAACLTLACICISCIFTISDTACHEAIKELGSDYGRTRCWGAVSWGLVAPLAGFLNDYTDSYVASWCLMVALCSLQVWNLTKMNLTKPDFTLSILKDLKVAFQSLEFVAFEVGVLMNGILTGIVWFYLTVYLISIGGNKLVIGLVHTIQCLAGELPFMFCSSWLTDRLGHFNIVSLALFAHALRFFLYSYIYNPWLVLPVDVLHGLTFGSFYSAMTSYAKMNAKPGTEATTQSILCATYEALGAGLGGIIFGSCFDAFGSHSAFFYAAGFSLLATAINVLFTKIVHCKKGELKVSTTEIEKY